MCGVAMRRCGCGARGWPGRASAPIVGKSSPGGSFVVLTCGGFGAQGSAPGAPHGARVGRSAAFTSSSIGGAWRVETAWGSKGISPSPK